MSKVAGNSVVVTVLNALTLVASLVLYPYILARFAPSETDNFFLAFGLASLVIVPLANAAGSVLIPVLTRCRLVRPLALEPTLGGALSWAALVAGGAATLMGAIGPVVLAGLGHWLPSHTAANVAIITLWLLPFVVIQSLTTVLDAATNALGRFWIPASAMLFRQLVTIAVIPLAKPAFGTLALAVAFTAGGIVHLIALLILWPWNQIHIRPTVTVPPDLKTTFRLAVPVLLGTVVLQIGMVVSRFLAVQVGAGGVTAFDYAARAAAAILEVTTSGVLLVTLADWAHLEASGASAQLSDKVRSTIGMVVFLVAPAIATLYALRFPVIQLWLGTSHSGTVLIEVVAATLGFFLLGVPLDIAARVYVRLFLVRQDTWILALLAVVRVFGTIGLALALIPALGIPALALGDTFGILIALAGLVWASGFHMRVSAPLAYREFGRTVIAAIAAWIVTRSLHFTTASYPPFIGIVVASCAGLGAYLAVAALLKSPELATTLGFFRRPQVFSRP